MKNIKKVLASLFVLALVLVGNIAYASSDVSLTVKNNGAVIFSQAITLPLAGTVSINDSTGGSHSVDADSVLSIVNTADQSSGAFDISNLIYYSSFSAFYVKCITPSGGSPLCDDWQYKVDGVDPAVGMDSKILSGGENVVLYFGDENVTQSSSGGGPLVEYVPPAEVETLPAPTITIAPIVVVPPPAPIPVPLLPQPLPAQEIAPKEQPVKSIAKVVNPKNKNKKLASIAAQNTAAAINAVNNNIPLKTENPTPAEKPGILRRFFNFLFGWF